MKQNDPQFGYNISKGGDGIDSDTIKKIWSDENFRAFASEKMKETWRDPKKRIRRSNYAKERWQDPSQREQIRKGIINACGRSVVCVESNIVYGTMQEAAIAHNVDKSNIHRAIKTGYKCGGCHWKYADNVS